jgi:predicted permease
MVTKMKKFLKILIIILIAVAILYFGFYNKSQIPILATISLIIYWLICGAIVLNLIEENLPDGDFIIDIAFKTLGILLGPISLICEIAYT